MELSFEVEAVREFLRKNGLKEAEKALEEDMMEKNEQEEEEEAVGAFDFEKFLFPMPPPVRIPATLRRSEVDEKVKSSDGSDSDSDEFVSLMSSTSDVGSSDFVNPYGLPSASQADSDTSSDRLSQFGTARNYPDFDMQNDLDWYDEKDEDHFMTPCFAGSGIYGCPSQDKFVTTSETEKQHDNALSSHKKSEGFQTDMTFINGENEVQVMDYYHFDKFKGLEAEIDRELKNCAYGCSLPLYKSFEGPDLYDENPVNFSYVGSKETDLDDLQLQADGDINADCNIASEHKSNKYLYSAKRGSNDWINGFKSDSDLVHKIAEKDLLPTTIDSYGGEDEEDNVELCESQASPDEEGDATDEPLMYSNVDEYEVFDLRIIHRKNRTGFEENKDLPIVLNTVIAGRYYVTEYIGSAAFSKVVQAHDLLMGIDVCLKIIKNDKDFFDQSLDEIKLLKLVNKYDPRDEHHILRLYDYFYHQEHLFIVCELLQANLYEFQKFNQESGGEAYFTLSRLQLITRQCLEALEYLHDLGIIHCDLKPENILIKSYRRCEIKIIDLGSSCFVTDNLCLYVQSRSYRAPEVILGLPYDQKIDLWSLGCILAELCSGEVLFPNDAVVMILARMVGMLGPIDMEMLEDGQETDKYFTKEYDLYHINEETNQLEYIISEETSLEHQLQVSDVGFIDFVRHLLQMNPQRRPTAREALEHPWLSYSY
ncbi:dual specificity tyrosine-phosphorylation-regulated kinase 4-like [Durio zibethinus]|uniref:Dual specificity tyrosine-phosphorylation-regulated kinase 4-like n=1 Tax=Durio zibethinus TaxID=66656 RepID=A0A6P5Z760_DURZI|nr:dual specificity tyrosine-phosphorylation-regulated kinase 4-like [Durio zibethinus]XP_022748212.1 dual specificity tyrosine-phosphorylation-regulated kinase 4-like [Durio zibethinus]